MLLASNTAAKVAKSAIMRKILIFGFLVNKYLYV